MLQVNDSGVGVLKLQSQLNALGFNLIPTGVFDQQTLGAVVTFQSQRGLTVDGIVGPMTQSALDSMLNVAPLNSLPNPIGVQAQAKIGVSPARGPSGATGIPINQQVTAASWLPGFSVPMWGWVVMGVMGALAIKQLRRG